MVVWLIYVCGMMDLFVDMVWFDDVVVVVYDVFMVGVLVFCDVEMVGCGIIIRNLLGRFEIICMFNDLEVLVLVKSFGIMRLVVVVELWWNWLEGVVVVIGNVLIVFFYFLELVVVGGLRLVVIFGFLVGFVGVVEFKEVLIVNLFGILYFVVMGCWGGFVMVVVVVNGLVVGFLEEI